MQCTDLGIEKLIHVTRTTAYRPWKSFVSISCSSFFSSLFLSIFLLFHAYFHPHFCAIFIFSFLNWLLFISAFPSASGSLYFLCFLSLYLSFSLLRVCQSPQIQTSCVMPTHRWYQQPSILVVLSYTNRSVNTIGSEELKSLIHEIKTTLFLLSALPTCCPCVTRPFNILLLQKHAAVAYSQMAECAHLAGLFRYIHSSCSCIKWSCISFYLDDLDTQISHELNL